MRISFFFVFASNYVDFRKLRREGKDVLFLLLTSQEAQKRNMAHVKKYLIVTTLHFFFPELHQIVSRFSLGGKNISLSSLLYKLLGRANRNMIKGEQISNWFISALMFTPQLISEC